jgi:hypothetical protein
MSPTTRDDFRSQFGLKVHRRRGAAAGETAASALMIRAVHPELPDYGAPLTIRHLLTHTSGLRLGQSGRQGMPGAPARTHAHWWKS